MLAFDPVVGFIETIQHDDGGFLLEFGIGEVFAQPPSLWSTPGFRLASSARKLSKNLAMYSKPLTEAIFIEIGELLLNAKVTRTAGRLEAGELTLCGSLRRSSCNRLSAQVVQRHLNREHNVEECLIAI